MVNEQFSSTLAASQAGGDVIHNSKEEPLS
jgi:hypothetical protein